MIIPYLTKEIEKLMAEKRKRKERDLRDADIKRSRFDSTERNYDNSSYIYYKETYLNDREGLN